MVDEFIKQLLEAGVHFGHQTKRWNPKMKPYIFGHKSDVYIIDLEKTVVCLNKARDFLMNTAAQGKKILFVGTKKQAQIPIEEEAKRCGMFYINQRWLGGLLTNFQTIKKRIARLKEIEAMQTNGTFDAFTKKEIARLNKELDRLLKNFSGIIEMNRLPDAIFLVDTTMEQTAVKEAQRLNIPIVAIVDTNCNPEDTTYPIPGNDDAMRSIKLLTTLAADSIVEGKKKFDASEVAAQKKAEEEARQEEIDIDEKLKGEVEKYEELEEEQKEELRRARRLKDKEEKF